MLFPTPAFIAKDMLGDSETDKFSSLFLNQESDMLIYAFTKDWKEMIHKSYKGLDILDILTVTKLIKL